MGYNVSALPAYTDQTGAIISKSVFGAKTASVIAKMPNVKGTKTVNIFDDASTFQADSCGFNAMDSTTLTQRTLTVGAIKVDKSWCPADVDGYYAQYLLKPGSYQTEIPFEQDLLTYVSEVIASQIETAIWQGDTGSGNANLSKFDGLLKIINAAGGLVVTGNTNVTATGITGTIDAIYAAIPVQVLAKDDFRIFMGFDTYRTYTTALKNANLYNYTPNTATDFEMFHPGTNIKIVAVNGLNGTSGKIVAARLSNLIYGFDLEDDSSDVHMWYSNDNQQVRATIKFKAGTQIAFPGEIVYYR